MIHSPFFWLIYKIIEKCQPCEAVDIYHGHEDNLLDEAERRNLDVNSHEFRKALEEAKLLEKLKD